MSIVGPLAIDMYLPGFPDIEREFATRGVETTMAAFILGIAIGQLFYGPISDRFGRKPPLYAGLLLYVVGALGCALSTSMAMLTVMRVVEALGGCAGMVIGRAVVRDRCEPHEAARAFTTLVMIVALGPIVAPALGGVIVTIAGWRGTFVFQALFGVVLMFAMHRLLSESHDVTRAPPVNFGGVLRNYARLCRDQRFMAYSLLIGFSMTSLFCYVTGAPRVIIENFGLSPQQFGWLIGLNGLAFMSASFLNMRALSSLTPAQVLARYVWFAPALGFAILLMNALISPPLWAFVSLQLLFFLGVARVNPNVSALALAPHGSSAGTASALMGTTQALITTVGGLAVAAFNDGTIRTLVTIMTASAVLAVLCYLWVRRLDGAASARS